MRHFHFAVDLFQEVENHMKATTAKLLPFIRLIVYPEATFNSLQPSVSFMFLFGLLAVCSSHFSPQQSSDRMIFMIHFV